MVETLAFVVAVIVAVVLPAVTVVALAYAMLQRATADWVRSNTAMINRGEPGAVVDAHWANPPWYARLARRLP